MNAVKSGLVTSAAAWEVAPSWAGTSGAAAEPGGFQEFQFLLKSEVSLLKIEFFLV